MMATLQRKFVLPVESLCVLLTVNGVRDRLASYDEDDVKALCLDHALAPAFDIGLGARQELRIAPGGLEFFLRVLDARRRRVSERELFAEVLRGSEGKPFLTGERVRLILNCGADHVNLLVDDGELAVLRGTERRRGPGGSDTITLASFKDFLKRRLM